MGSPVSAVLSTLRDALELLAGGDETSTCRIVPEPCRVALYPSGNVPWDNCESGCNGASSDGQLWAAFIGVSAVGGEPGNGPCRRFTFTAEIGVVRCEKAKLGDDGQMPASALVEADSDQQAADADAISNALVCCDTRPESLRDLELVSWAPRGPSGGCVGGVWTVRGVLDVCC